MRYFPTWKPMSPQEISDQLEIHQENLVLLMDFTMMRVLSVGWSDTASYVILEPLLKEGDVRRISLDDTNLYQINGLSRALSSEFRSIYDTCCQAIMPLDEESDIFRVHMGRWMIKNWEHALNCISNHEEVDHALKKLYDFHAQFFDCPKDACEKAGFADDIDEDLQKLYEKE